MKYQSYRSSPAALRFRLALLGVVPIAATHVACRNDAGCDGESCFTAVIVASADADVLLPPVTTQNVGTAVSDLVFLRLADIGHELNTVDASTFAPRLARSWKVEDTRTISFHLHDRAKWHDGVSVTPEDVVFTFSVYRDTLINSRFRQALSSVESVTASDSETVEFRFSRWYPEQFYDATQHMRILPAHILDTIPRNRLAAHEFGRAPVGSGPYRFVRWVPGELIELAADTAFFLGAPGLRRLIWRVTSDDAVAISQLVAGEADVTAAIMGAENLQRIRDAARLRLVSYPSPVYSFVAYNHRDPEDVTRPHPLFRSRRLRRALTMGVDRGAIVRAVLGDAGSVPRGPTSRTLWVWSDSIPEIPFDTTAAKQSLAELGWEDSDGDGVVDRGGRALEFEILIPGTSRSRERAAVIMQEQLRRVGVAVRINSLDFNAFLGKARSGKFDVVFGAFVVDPSPAGIEDLWGTAGIGGSNWGRYSNPTFDSLTHAALNAREPQTAAALWHQALSFIVADAPAIWMFEPVMHAAVHQRFRNVTVRPDQWAADLWMWEVTGESQGN